LFWSLRDKPLQSFFHPVVLSAPVACRSPRKPGSRLTPKKLCRFAPKPLQSFAKTLISSAPVTAGSPCKSGSPFLSFITSAIKSQFAFFAFIRG